MKNSIILKIKLRRMILKLSLVFLILLFTYKLINIQSINIKKEKELKELNNKISTNIKNNEILKKQIKFNVTDDFKESYARKNLDMIKNGERVFYDITLEWNYLHFSVGGNLK